MDTDPFCGFVLTRTVTIFMMSDTRSDECEYCSVCRYNHSEGRKHVYVKSHQQKLWVILNKFGEKVQLARCCALKPSVLEGEQPGMVLLL